MKKLQKPIGWPKYMRAKRLSNGMEAYFWEPPTWARRNNCPVDAEALGSDYATAKQRCDEVLNVQFDAWRTKDEAPGRIACFGTFDWMISVYKRNRFYSSLPERTKRDIDRALGLASKFALKDGRTFGMLNVKSINPGVADRLFERLREKPDGTTRDRTALLTMQYCRRAWNVSRRDYPRDIPLDNPFEKMNIAYRPESTRPITHAELMRFVEAADVCGYSSIGTAAQIAFFWLQRQTDIIRRLTWSHYRPNDAPDCVRVRHHKTDQVVDIPLYDSDGSSLWPELTRRLDAMERRGPLIIMRDKPDRKRKMYLPWKEDHFRHCVAEIRNAAGIDSSVKFMGIRHGGNTEGANAGLSDAQLRALSGHKTSAALLRYAQSTKEQRQTGARLRLAARTKGGHLSE